MRYRDQRRSLCLSSQSGCPLTCSFCATGPDEVRAQPHGERDPRPGAALPPQRRGRPRRLHGHGRADDEPRQRPRGLRAPARPGHHPPPHGDLDRRLDPGHRRARRAAHADPPRALRPRRRRGAALGDHARQRPLPAGRRARRLPALLRGQAPDGLRRVRHARRRQRPLRAGRRAGPRPGPEDVQGQPHPLQPDRDVRRLQPRGDRRVQGRARGARRSARRCASRAGATSTPRAASWRRRHEALAQPPDAARRLRPRGRRRRAHVAPAGRAPRRPAPAHARPARAREHAAAAGRVRPRRRPPAHARRPAHQARHARGRVVRRLGRAAAGDQGAPSASTAWRCWPRPGSIATTPSGRRRSSPSARRRRRCSRPATSRARWRSACASGSRAPACATSSRR